MDQSDGGQKTDAKPTRKPFRLIAIFVVGMIFGLGYARFRDWTTAKVNVDIVGADVSRAGGISIFVAGSDGYIRQSCNGVCDNIGYKFRSRGPDYTLKIDDKDGSCVFCPNTYTTTYMNNYDKVSGKDKLKLDGDFAIVHSYKR